MQTLKCNAVRWSIARASLLLATTAPAVSGCNDAILDAAAAGGLDFIQSSVTALLSSSVLPELELSGAAAQADDGSAAEGHTGHGD